MIRALGITGQDGFVEAAIPSQSGANVDFWGDGFSTGGLHPIQAGGAAIVAGLVAPF
ncbi:hypothetical protein [Aureimonas sp. Leaf324]|jgi:hypothetical protein|uniref:hypothetical protein n=1 Tax=Aureimonas sp. Leaf324 TaxID=1736336 RepID=UPI000ACDAB1A|nr:hypothetical protein [Aureimonas sp. Leaf324]